MKPTQRFIDIKGSFGSQLRHRWLAEGLEAVLHLFLQRKKKSCISVTESSTEDQLQPSEKGLIFVENRFHIIEDRDQIFRLQCPKVNICSWKTVKEVGETGLLWVDIHGSLCYIIAYIKRKRDRIRSPI